MVAAHGGGLRAGSRGRGAGDTDRIGARLPGFSLGAGSRFTYRVLAEGDEAELAEFDDSLLPWRLHGLAVAKRPIYLDCQATTPLDPRVVGAMVEAFDVFGNPHARQHAYGRAAANAVDTARSRVAGLVGAYPQRIVFHVRGDGVLQPRATGRGPGRPARAAAHRDASHGTRGRS